MLSNNIHEVHFISAVYTLFCRRNSDANVEGALWMVATTSQDTQGYDRLTLT